MLKIHIYLIFITITNTWQKHLMSKVYCSLIIFVVHLSRWSGLICMVFDDGSRWIMQGQEGLCHKPGSWEAGSLFISMSMWSLSPMWPNYEYPILKPSPAQSLKLELTTRATIEFQYILYNINIYSLIISIKLWGSST